MIPKISFLGLVLSIFTLAAYAQNTIVKGKIMDRESGEAIEYASIALYQLSDSVLLTGVVTEVEAPLK